MGDLDRVVAASAICVVASLGYLIAVSRTNGAEPVRAVRRAGAVWVLGILYAASLSSIALAYIAPVFVDGYAGSNDFVATAKMLIVTSTASLNFGVLIQTIRSGQPITYPLLTGSSVAGSRR